MGWVRLGLLEDAELEMIAEWRNKVSLEMDEKGGGTDTSPQACSALALQVAAADKSSSSTDWVPPTALVAPKGNKAKGQAKKLESQADFLSFFKGKA